MDRKVLVVDDSATMRMIVQATLTNAGRPVVLAADGRQALDMLARERVALLITDWNMPVMDGPALIQAVRADPALADLPVVVLTTEGDEAAQDQAQSLGVIGWLGKPVDPATLVGVVDELLPPAQSQGTS